MSSGGKAIGTTVYGEEQVVLGGVASSTTIEAGGALLAGSSTVSNTVVLSRGLEQLGVASVDTGTTVSAGGTQWVYDTAVVNNAVLNGGIQVIGAVTSSTAFGTQATSGGTATGTVVNSGGTEYVGFDATASGKLITSGGTQQVGGSTVWSYYYQVSSGVAGSTISTNLSGGIVSGTILSAGAPHGSGTETTQIVGSGGTAIDTTLESYAVQRVSAGGVASGTIIDSGNVQAVGSGGSSIDAVVNSGGLEQGAGTVSGTTVSSGGVETVNSGGTADNVTLSGGVQIVGGTQSSTLSGSAALTGIASGTVISAGGTQYVGSGATVTGTTVTSGGTQQIGGSTTYDYAPGTIISVTLGAGVATGTTVSNGGTEIVSSGGTASGTTVSSGGLVKVISGGSITGTDLISGGTINLAYASYVSGATAVLNASTDVLTVTDGSNSYDLQMAGSYTQGFAVIEASDGSVDIILCFYPGTRLAAEDGEIEVQDVKAGTMLRVADGRVLPVRWVGRSEVSMRFADPLRSLPIRIKAGALADNLPVRDLLVSPDHVMFLDDVLIQAGALINGLTILREENVPEYFTYYHVELETHELLLAEGAPTESFVDNVDRMHFQNWDERAAATLAAPIVEMPYPRAKSYRQVPKRLRAMLEARAGLAANRGVA